MVEKAYILSVDLGTTRIKTGIFTKNGELVDYAYSTYPLYIPKEEFVEEDPKDWIAGFSVCMEKLKAKNQLQYVVSIIVIGQAPTTVFVDSNGIPLRNAILWLDKRVEDEKKIKKVFGFAKDPRYQALAQILWVKRYERDIYNKTAYFLQPYDFINLYLTGIFSQSGIPHRDYLTWTKEDASLLGIDTSKLLPTIPMGEVIGTVKKEIAKELGIKESVKVISGGVDYIGALIGTGALTPGILCNRGGGSEGITFISDTPLPKNEKRVSTVPFFLPKLWKISGLINTSGKAIDWIKELFSIKNYGLLTQIAKESPPGAKNLIFLPYLSGERSPHWDRNAKGLFFGLTLSHGKQDIIRSTMEGIIYAIKDVYEIIRSYPVNIEHFRVTGGLSKMLFFTQLKADILGVSIEIPKVSDGELLGAAIIGGVGMGLYKNLKEASENMYKVKRILLPNNENREKYEKLFLLYKELYPSLRDKFKEI